MKITKAKPSADRIKVKTKSGNDGSDGSVLAEWWTAEDDKKLAAQLCGTAAYLKTNQTYRMRQLACDVRLYCGLSIYSYAGSNVQKMDRTKTLPDDRPTFNIIQSATDTLVSRLSQSKPEPKFLTDSADYKQRHLGQRLNSFILGEFYQTRAYEKAVKMLRDGIVMGTGCLKVYEGDDGRVNVDRVLITDLFMDDNDSLNGEPQQLVQLKLMDRDKLMANSPKKASGIIAGTPQSYPDNSPDSGRTVADQVMVVEGWKLPSGPDPMAPGYVSGRHVITTTNGTILDDPWDKPKFPFVFMNYSDPFLGFFGQGLATQLFGTQLTLNRILYQIARMIMLSTPKWLVEKSSGIPKAHFDNQLGSIMMYQAVKPEFITPPCNAGELYQERDKLIQYGFQQCGVSSMQATAQKPQGLDSGEAIRSYDDISTDRFSALSKRYDNVFVDLAYLIADTAKDIAKRDGKYQTVYPNKDGTKEIDLPAMKFLNDPFVIQCFTESSLPRTPAGRIQTVTELVQAGMLTLKEGYRLMRLGGDGIEQIDKLNNASEERIFKMLDAIVESGSEESPDAFLDLELAKQLTTQYINLYLAAGLEESKADMLRDFFQQVTALMELAEQGAMQKQMAQQAAMAPPQANPEAAPTSPLVPNSPNPQQMAS